MKENADEIKKIDKNIKLIDEKIKTLERERLKLIFKKYSMIDKDSPFMVHKDILEFLKK